MKGNVSLENNGGFVQVALPLAMGSKTFDATAYSGVRFWVKGNGQQYYVHLKNDKTTLHWHYYSAGVRASGRSVFKVILILYCMINVSNVMNRQTVSGMFEPDLTWSPTIP